MTISDFIDLGGGATPRPREKPDILLNAKAAPKVISNSKFEILIQKMKETGKVDLMDFGTTEEMCRFIDFYNDTVASKKQKQFEKDITDRNEYYYKLWSRAIDATR